MSLHVSFLSCLPPSPCCSFLGHPPRDHGGRFDPVFLGASFVIDGIASLPDCIGHIGQCHLIDCRADQGTCGFAGQNGCRRDCSEGDPRRRPTFRFDHGDVYWARAFVSFQRAALDILLAYRWTEIDKIFRFVRGRSTTITIRMEKPELVAEAKRRILEGLDFADRSRRAYLAEKDDDREWVPNPRQKSHPLPLPVDDKLYDTWEAVLCDLERLVKGKEGLSVERLAQLGDHKWDNPPGGYIDIGRMLSRPKDIVFKLDELKRLDRADDVEGALRSVLGEYYVRRMKASPITGRLDRMKNEVKRGEESLERKLRYLFWLN